MKDFIKTFKDTSKYIARGLLETIVAIFVMLIVIVLPLGIIGYLTYLIVTMVSILLGILLCGVMLFIYSVLMTMWSKT